MKNIFVVFKREYLTRVKNKTFIIMTFLAPLLIFSFFAILFQVTGLDVLEKYLNLYTSLTLGSLKEERRADQM